MAKSKNEKVTPSLEMTLVAAKSFTIINPKTVQFDGSIISKVKNIAIDFPELGLSPTKLLNVIVSKWLENHREELLKNHISNARERY